MAVILNLAILDSAILVFPLKVTRTCQDWFPLFSQKNFTHSFWLNLVISAILNSAILYLAISKKKLHSCILPQIDDCSHLEFCYLGFSHFAQKKFTCSFWLNFMKATILNSAILDSAILHKTLTQTSSIRLKLIHSESTWWWQLFWILPSWFQTLSSWIQTPCDLLSDSFKNTLPLHWPWLKLIQSD